MRLSEIDIDIADKSQRGMRLSEAMADPAKPQKRDLLDTLAGASPEQMIAMGHPAVAAFQQAGKDLLTIPAKAANVASMGYLKPAVEKSGFRYPDKAESPVMRGLGIGGDVAGVALSPVIKGATAFTKIPQVAKTLSKIPNILKASGAGAAFGGAYAPEEGQSRAGNAAISAAIPFAGSVAVKGLKSLAAHTPEAVLHGMNRFNQALKNAYDDGVKYAFKGGKKVEISNPIKTITGMQLVPKVKAGRTDTTHIVEDLTNKIGELDGAYKTTIPQEVTIPLKQLKVIATKNIRGLKDLKASGSVGATIKKLDAMFEDYAQSYGDEIPLSVVDDIRVTMNKRFDPEMRDVFRSVGDASRKVIYETIPQARPILQKEGELLAARNYADVLNNRPVKGGRLGNYFGQTVGAMTGGALGHSPASVAAGAGAGNLLSRGFQKMTFVNPLGKPAQKILEGGKRVSGFLKKEIEKPYFTGKAKIPQGTGVTPEVMPRIGYQPTRLLPGQPIGLPDKSGAKFRMISGSSPETPSAPLPAGYPNPSLRLPVTRTGERINPADIPQTSEAAREILKERWKGTVLPAAVIGGGAAMAGEAKAGQDIDMNRIYQIESSGNPKAHNKSSNARGLGQITPIVLKEWNNFHPSQKHVADDLFNADINKKISSWYLNNRIPQMLKAYKLPDTDRNRIIAYNAGISYVKNGKPIPEETKKYLKKYGI